MIFNSIQPLEAACPWPRNAMKWQESIEMCDCWPIKSPVSIPDAGNIEIDFLFHRHGDDVALMVLVMTKSEKWNLNKMQFILPRLIYTNDKGFRGEDFVDAIRILIQATETTIWLQCNAGPQYSNCFTSPFQILLCYCIYFWQYSISLFSTSFLVFLTVYVAKEMVNMVDIIICFCVERSQKVWW